jgi:hypothetical protein
MQDKVHVPPGAGPAFLDEVEGFTSASPVRSLTTSAGTRRLELIEGVGVASRALCPIAMAISRKSFEPIGE